MLAQAATHKRLVVVGADSRLEIGVPIDQPLATALQSMGVELDPHRHALLDDNGRQVPGDTLPDSLRDGALLTIVDVNAGSGAPGDSGDDSRLGPLRNDVAAPWWMLVTLTALLLVASVLDLAAGSTLLGPTARIAVAGVIALGAMGTGVMWSRRHEPQREPAALVAPILLAFTSAIVGTPAIYKGAHAALTAGLLAAGVLGTLLAVTSNHRTGRALAGAASTWSLTLGTVWGATLIFEWSAWAAAALSLGLVAAGLRFIPTRLLRLPEGYAIEYQHFLGNRWSVRGAIPKDPGPVTMEVVQPYVDEAAARLTVGVMVLSAVAAFMTPWVVGGIHAESIFQRIGTITVLITTVLGLLLWSRRTSAPELRWPPRLAAAVMVGVTVLSLANTADATGRVVVAASLLGVGLVALGVLVPVSRHRAALGWSRLGDILETLSVVLAPPAAMLAAGTLDFVRAVMSG